MVQEVDSSKAVRPPQKCGPAGALAGKTCGDNAHSLQMMAEIRLPLECKKQSMQARTQARRARRKQVLRVECSLLCKCA
jgi:hypothetical protein